ncbi:MAG: CdaR family protein [Chloroflexota bacterium]
MILLAPLRWIARNLSTLLLAFILAVVVWVSAVVTADPNEEQTFGPVQIERVGLAEDMLLVSEAPSQAFLTLRAPRSIWQKLEENPSLVQTWIDLSGLEAGEHVLKVMTQVDISPLRYVKIDPQEIRLVLEPLVRIDVPVELVVNGELPLGYRKGSPELEPLEVTISGPESAVTRVTRVHTTLDISGAVETFKRLLTVVAVDENDLPVNNVTIAPKVVSVTQPVSLLGGFKNVVVKVLTTGQVANGYRLTNISVSPPTVTLFSENPQRLNEIPGFVDTLPVDLTGLSDDIEINVGLNLSDGITLVREAGVLVQVSVAAIEGSLTLTLPVEVVGLSPELMAEISPKTVDVIVAGPLIVLDKLSPASFRVVLDLTGLPPGVYQRPPSVDVLSDQVRVQTTLPETVEVVIELAPTPTPTPTPESTSETPQPPSITETPQP